MANYVITDKDHFIVFTVTKNKTIEVYNCYSIQTDIKRKPNYSAIELLSPTSDFECEPLSSEYGVDLEEIIRSQQDRFGFFGPQMDPYGFEHSILDPESYFTPKKLFNQPTNIDFDQFLEKIQQGNNSSTKAENEIQINDYSFNLRRIVSHLRSTRANKKPQAKVFQIYQESNNPTDISSCTATMLKRNGACHLITNVHCLDKNSVSLVDPETGEKISIPVVQRNTCMDIAILSNQNPIVEKYCAEIDPFRSFNYEDLKQVHNPIRTIGFAKNQMQQLMVGKTIEDLYKVQNATTAEQIELSGEKCNYRHMQLNSAPVLKGMSGGHVEDFITKDFLGITTFMLPYYHAPIVVPPEHIAMLIDKQSNSLPESEAGTILEMRENYQKLKINNLKYIFAFTSDAKAVPPSDAKAIPPSDGDDKAINPEERLLDNSVFAKHNTLQNNCNFFDPDNYFGAFGVDASFFENKAIVDRLQRSSDFLAEYQGIYHWSPGQKAGLLSQLKRDPNDSTRFTKIGETAFNAPILQIYKNALGDVTIKVSTGVEYSPKLSSLTQMPAVAQSPEQLIEYYYKADFNKDGDLTGLTPISKIKGNKARKKLICKPNVRKLIACNSKDSILILDLHETNRFIMSVETESGLDYHHAELVRNANSKQQPTVFFPDLKSLPKTYLPERKIK